MLDWDFKLTWGRFFAAMMIGSVGSYAFVFIRDVFQAIRLYQSTKADGERRFGWDVTSKYSLPAIDGLLHKFDQAIESNDNMHGVGNRGWLDWYALDKAYRHGKADLEETRRRVFESIQAMKVSQS